MVGPRVQKKVGFKLASHSTPIEGITSRVTSLKELRAKQNRVYISQAKSLADNGRKAVVKMIVADKAKQMFKSLKPSDKLCFEEMLKEIKLNPNMALDDIAVKVIRTLKNANPNEYYAPGAVRRLYQAGVKVGAIKLS